jgi:membrane fusion protein, multidrug efflux system
VALKNDVNASSELERDGTAQKQAGDEETRGQQVLAEAKQPAPAALRPGGDGSQNKPPQAADARGNRTRRSFIRRHPVATAISAILLIAAGAGGYLYWDYASHFETTDDAFIGSRQFGVAPQVSGYLTAVPVTDNQHVMTGDVIARIDDRTYRVALEQAQAQIASAQASIENLDAQMTVQQAQIESNQAQVEQAQAALVYAQQEAVRYQELANRAAGTVENAQQWAATQRQDQAALKNAQTVVTLAQRQLDALKAQRGGAQASLAQAQAQRDQAQLNLSYATVTAAQPGRVVNLTAAVGQFVQPGVSLTMFVPDEIWVTANFKETQLDQMRPGQPVTISIDAYPEHDIHGHVDSVQPGSGTAFSLLPAENATGNFVKVVQRVPVKIVMENPPTGLPLGPGLSIEPSVRVNPAPPLYERLIGRQ